MTSLAPGDRIDRYLVEGPLGQGGMGEVYRAFDPKLGRRVALKRMSPAAGSDAAARARLVREARAAAALDHPNVVAIFDVGEVEGAPFIAMELVVGAPLRRFIGDARVSTRRRIGWLVEIARALSAAHERGLVHRDVKPENVMIRDDGAVKVVDFGIARALADRGDPSATPAVAPSDAAIVTRDDAVVGTTLYMAPEQARGGPVDARADQFAWAVVAHELLTGAHPWGKGLDAKSLRACRDVVTALLFAEPPPLDGVPDLPPRLATAVKRALAKEPDDRFASMDELLATITDAESMARTPHAKVAADVSPAATTMEASGEDTARPITATPETTARPVMRASSAASRLGTRIAEHRVAVATAALAVLLAAGGARYLIGARASAAEQERAALRLGEEAARVDAIARRSALLPLHDTRRERAEIEDEMRRIEADMNRAPASRATGQFALGRGYLALRDPESARAALEKAASMTREARVEQALGEALGELYRLAIANAQRVPAAVRDEQLKVATEKLRDPALAHLRAAKELGGDSDRVEGLIALYERRFDDATRAARAAFERDPFAYEAKELEADIEYSKAGYLYTDGKYAESVATYERAGQAYDAALVIARSNATLYAKAVRRHTWQMAAEIELGRGPGDHYESAMDLADRAAIADADDARGHRARAEMAEAVASWQSKHGQDPTRAFEVAIGAARRAAELAPDDGEIRRMLADTLSERGKHERGHGVDPTTSFEAAIVEYQAELARGDGDAWCYNGLAITQSALTLYRNEQGLEPDPIPGLRVAVASFERAVARYPSLASPHVNMCNTLRQLAEQEAMRGIDPRPTLDRAAAEAAAVIKVAPTSTGGLLNRGLIELRRGEAATVRGDDPSGYFASAMRDFDTLLERNPREAMAVQDRGNVWLARADDDRAHGRDALPSVREAVRAFDARAAIDPGSYWAPRQAAEAWRIAAYDALEGGRDALTAIAAADAAIARALAIKGNDLPAKALAAEMAVLRARAAQTGQEAALADAESRATAILAEDPKNPDALRVAADVHRERARVIASRRGDPSDEVRASLDACAKVLAVLPGDARALAIRGAARRIDAGARDDEATRALARDDLDAAAKADARLTRAVALFARGS